MRDVLRLGFILFVICAVAAGALALVNEITRDRIAAQAALRLQRAFEDVLPDAEEFNDVTEDVRVLIAQQADPKPAFSSIDKVYAGYSDGGLAGLAFICTPSGYGGPIESVVGVSCDGAVTGLSVVRHTETPGLGANVTDREFQKQFSGVQAGTAVKVNKDGGRIQAITGATISSRAVTYSVDEALRLFELLRNGGELEDEL